MSTVRIISSPGSVACGECGGPILFHERYDLHRARARAECVSPSCVNHGKQFWFQLQVTQAELVGEEGANG
jgi:hypothetical protein